MSRFPVLPKLRGGTDDEASIHLHRHVGPSQPAEKRDYERHIGWILDDSDTETVYEKDTDNRFSEYVKTKKQRPYSFFLGLAIGLLLFFSTYIRVPGAVSDFSEVLQTQLAVLESRQKALFEQLHAEVNDLKSQIERVGSRIQNVERRIESESIPEYAPVFVKDKKIHYIPEFQRLVEKLVHSVDVEAAVVEQLNQHMPLLLESPHLETLLKEEVQKQTQTLTRQLNLLTERTDLGNSSFPLDKVLETLSRRPGVNYADHSLGARTLGFLTQQKKEPRSLARKLLLGWFDFLQSVKAPQSLRHHANNALADTDVAWTCALPRCSIGIRLSSAVTLTHLAIDADADATVLLYIKPRARDADRLVGYLLRFHPHYVHLRVLKRFYKVSEQPLLRHMKLPVTIVNMGLCVHDIYLEIVAARPVAITQIRAYGVTEHYVPVLGEDDTL